MNSFIEVYLAKQNFRPEIREEPVSGLNFCVVIPCFNESGLIRSLQSLWNCMRPAMPVEVIIVINSSEHSSPEVLKQNLNTSHDALCWISDHFDPELRFHIIRKPNLPHKFAGVGLARKIGMDEAVYRLNCVNQPRGIITGFDADSVCDPNYLVEIEKHFQQQIKASGASIYFEHPFSDSESGLEISDGIVLYELHLRYLLQSLRYAGHPHSFHTIGSSFAVRMDEYVKQGGMNKRLAGEDFYFLQKLIVLGTFSEINTTRMIPSSRESDRVPFGTGASIKRWMTENSMSTYPPRAFEDIRILIEHIPAFYEDFPASFQSLIKRLPSPLIEFLEVNSAENEIASIRSNSASFETFYARFFRWFNAFRVIKYLNFSREIYDDKQDIVLAASILARKLNFEVKSMLAKDLLNFYRELDRSGFGVIQQQ